MRYFLISICFVLAACGSYPKKQAFQKTETTDTFIQNPYFANPEIDYIYKANISVYNNTFGGIFIVKKIADNNHRVVFTTEMGNKILDFSFINDDFKVNYILDELNKKILINILKKDFKVLVQEQLHVINKYESEGLSVFETTQNNKTHFYFKSKQIDKIVRIGNRKEKAEFLFQEINHDIAEYIQINHFNIKLNINLKRIN